MDTRSRKIAGNTLFLYLRMFFVMAVSVYTVRVVLNNLGIEDYGVYSAVSGLVVSLSFLTSVLANASQRFFSVGIGKGDTKNLRATFSMMFLLYVAVGIFIIVLFETFGPWLISRKMVLPPGRIPAAYWVLQCMTFSFAFSIIAAPYQALLISKEKMSVYAYIGILDVILKLAIAVVISNTSADKLKLYALLLMGVSVITNLCYLLYCRINYEEARVVLYWDRSLFKEIFSFSSWTLFGSLSYVCNTQGLNLLLNFFFGPVVNAAYAIGNQVKTFINQFSSSFYTAVRPPLMKACSAGEDAYAKSLFYFSSKVIFILLFIIVFPFFMHCDDLLAVWLGTVGEHMPQFVRLMLLYAVILSMSDPITTVIQAEDCVKRYYLTVDTFTLLSLPASYLSFKFGGDPEYAFYISISIFTIAHFIRLSVLKRVMSITIIEYCKQLLLPIIAVILVCSVLSFFTSRILLTSVLSFRWGFVVMFFIDFVFSFLSSILILTKKAERCELLHLITSRLKLKRSL